MEKIGLKCTDPWEDPECNVRFNYTYKKGTTGYGRFCRFEDGKVWCLFGEDAGQAYVRSNVANFHESLRETLEEEGYTADFYSEDKEDFVGVDQHVVIVDDLFDEEENQV